MPTYTGELPKDLVLTTPTEGATLPSEINDSIREVKRLLANLNTVKSVSTAGTTTLTAQDFLVNADATAGAITIALPDVATLSTATKTKIYAIKKCDSSANTVTVDPFGTQTIDGASTIVISLTNDTLIIAAIGSTWRDISNNAITVSDLPTHGASKHDSTVEATANKGAVSGYASLDSGTKVPTAQLGTGTPDATTFLRGDRSWINPIQLMGSSQNDALETTANTTPTNTNVSIGAFTAVAGATYLIMATCAVGNDTVNTFTFVDIFRDAASSEANITKFQRSTVAGSEENSVTMFHVDTPGAQSVTYRVRFYRDASAGNARIDTKRLLVFRIS